jgi:hypothetical protein
MVENLYESLINNIPKKDAISKLEKIIKIYESIQDNNLYSMPLKENMKEFWNYASEISGIKLPKKTMNLLILTHDSSATFYIANFADNFTPEDKDYEIIKEMIHSFKVDLMQKERSVLY